jgi:hypothetical protein
MELKGNLNRWRAYEDFMGIHTMELKEKLGMIGIRL